MAESPEVLAMWVESWARTSDVPVRRPGASAGGEGTGLAAALDSDPETDFGRFIYQTPACLIEPRSRDELIECVRQFAERRVPFKVRACAHSAGGQVLSRGGVVISTRRLCRVASESPESSRVRVEGGALWFDVVQYLRPSGRRPPVLTDNLLTTVGGTLAVGGVGNTSHLHGLQTAAVTRLVLVLATGEVVGVGPGDALFWFTLAGAGQLGIIAEAELKVVSRPPHVITRRRRWRSLSEFCDAATRIRTTGRFEVLSARFYFRTPSAPSFVEAHVGVFGVRGGGDAPDQMPGSAAGGAMPPPPRSWIDAELYGTGSVRERSPETTCPTIQFFLPLPDGIDVWARVVRDLEYAGVTGYMPVGAGVIVLPVDRRYPVAPYPDSGECLFVGMRPEVPRRDIARVLPVLQEVASDVLDAGGKLYLSGISPNRDFVRQQFGRALDELRALKARVDPYGLLNPGLLTREAESS